MMKFSLCNFLHSAITSSLLGPNILLRTLFSNTLFLGAYNLYVNLTLFSFCYSESLYNKSQPILLHFAEFGDGATLSKTRVCQVPSIQPSNGATAQIGPWPPLLRFHNNDVLRCEVVSLTTNPH
jgi:hypothetical protein